MVTQTIRSTRSALLHIPRTASRI